MSVGITGFAALVAFGACAGAAAGPRAGAWLHPSFGATQLERHTIVVLPVASVAVPDAAPTDSAAVALAALAGDALATAMEAGGAAGLAIEPARAMAELRGLTDAELDALVVSLDPRILEPDVGGELSGEAAALWRDVANRTRERYFLTPRSLAIERLEPLRVRATFDVWLVDANAAVVLWQAPIGARNAHAPSGAAVDIYERALEDAVDAAAGGLAARLAALVRTGRDAVEPARP